VCVCFGVCVSVCIFVYVCVGGWGSLYMYGFFGVCVSAYVCEHGSGCAGVVVCVRVSLIESVSVCER